MFIRYLISWELGLRFFWQKFESKFPLSFLFCQILENKFPRNYFFQKKMLKMGSKIFTNCRQMGKNEEKWLRNCDFFRFSHMVTLISFIIAYWTYWQNFKSSWALKPDLYVMYIFHKINQSMEYMDYCICILSIYGYPKKKMLNAKKSSWFFL